MPILLLRILFDRVHSLWRMIFSVEKMSPDNILLEQVSYNTRKKKFLIKLAVLGAFYVFFLLILCFEAGKNIAWEDAIMGTLTGAILMALFFSPLVYSSYKEFKVTHIEVYLDGTQQKLESRKGSRKARDIWGAIAFCTSFVFLYAAFIPPFEEQIKAICWFLGLNLISAICLFPESTKKLFLKVFTVLGWILGAGIMVVGAVFIYKGIATLPVSVAVIIGAFIITGAVKQNR